MVDFKSPRLIVLKGALFLVLGCLASAQILLISGDWKVGILLVLAIWSFCRCYYFAFYVIEHYVDPHYKYSGLIAFAAYWMDQLRGRPPGGTP